MATNYPTSIDTLTNPAGTDSVETVDHAAQHANANDAVEALEAKVGADGSAVTTSHDYKLSGVTSTDKAASLTGTETLTNKTVDVDSNTFSNIEMDNLKSTAKTGLDTAAVTGTAGTSGDLLKWNADGDAVSADTVTIAQGGTGQTAQTAAFDALAPTTTKADIVVHNGTDNIRLPIGTNDQVLTADSTEASGVKWAASSGSVTPVVNVYTASDTWTKPAGLSYVEVEVVGGGGGSAGQEAGHTSDTGAAGGGGGGYSREVIDAALLASSETVTVGAGGTAGATTGDTSGGTGGTSSFGTTPFLQATGGQGGQESNTAGGTGGSGSSGDVNVAGGPGEAGGLAGGSGGNGGSSVLGGGGRGGNESSNGASVGGAYGGGAGGGRDTTTGTEPGATGAAGVVIVREYF